MANVGDNSSQIDISKEEKDKLVAEVIRYIVFKTHQNSGCPIKREELSQIVTKSYRNRGLPSVVINEAAEKLSTIFGYELKELHRSRPSSNYQTRSSRTIASVVSDTTSYILLSKLPADVYKKYVDNEKTAHLTGFAFVVISIVHLAGGKIAQEGLWHHLRRMGLSETDDKHPVFGNVKQALESLVQQRYLHKDKVNGPEGNTLFYELAERALCGSIPDKIKEHISKIVSKDVVVLEN